MIRENWRYTYEPVEFEKQPVEFFKTLGKLPIILEGFVQYTPI